MKTPWDELSLSERLSIALYYGANRYIRECIEEEEQHQRMMATVNNTVSLCQRAFRRRRGKK